MDIATYICPQIPTPPDGRKERTRFSDCHLGSGASLATGNRLVYRFSDSNDSWHSNLFDNWHSFPDEWKTCVPQLNLCIEIFWPAQLTVSSRFPSPNIYNYIQFGLLEVGVLPPPRISFASLPPSEHVVCWYFRACILGRPVVRSIQSAYETCHPRWLYFESDEIVVRFNTPNIFGL